MLLQLGFLSRKRHCKGFWCRSEEMTLSGCFACAISAKSNRKSQIVSTSTSVTGNNCALVKSLLALEMIRKAAMNHKVVAQEHNLGGRFALSETFVCMLILRCIAA